MSYPDELYARMHVQQASHEDQHAWQDRFDAELTFARQLITLHPEQPVWPSLLLESLDCYSAALARGDGMPTAVTAAEAVLSPLTSVAKTYVVHCVGHAHIDMNWMWNWPETVMLTHDTFVTIDRLMDEFPTFHFSQSQASVYTIVKEYFPELYERVRARIREGRWEVTANHWVEGEKNLASGESICRQMLYARRFVHEEFGFAGEEAVLDWEPDTFGHPHTLPGLISSAGMRYYYFCRAGVGPHLFWWQGKDGARVLAFDDLRKWYHCMLTPKNVLDFLEGYVRETGLRDYLLVYGVGDHGGGPTRQDLRYGARMSGWPIFPTLKFGSAQDFFAAVEPHAGHLPVIDREMNPTLEGCYTSQSAIKHANRRSETLMTESETIALLGEGLLEMPYPRQKLHAAWVRTLFNQFHDILPGSGARATYDHAQGSYQEILATTSAIKTMTLHKLAARINTAPCPCGGLPVSGGFRSGQGIGAGMGDLPGDGAISRLGAGSDCCDPYVVFNANPWPRTEVVTVRVWNRDYPDNHLYVIDDAGNRFPAQFLAQAPYWWSQHHFREFAFPATAIPGCGYRSYRLVHGRPADVSTACCFAQVTGIGNSGIEALPSYPGVVKGILENEYLRVELEQESGAVTLLLDKQSGRNLVPDGAQFALLEYLRECPHGMTAWKIDQAIETVLLNSGGTLECVHNGLYLATLRASKQWRESTFTIDYTLKAESPLLELTLTVDWQEPGSPTRGVPTLRMAFPLAATKTRVRFECPNGHVTREADGREVPGQKWVDISGTHVEDGQPLGLLLLNDDKYGFNARGNTLRVSLLRSSYDPDPLPEIGKHVIKLALCPHNGTLSAGTAARAGQDFNQPLSIVGAGEHQGDLPATCGFAELLTANAMLSGMKRAEDGEGLIVRLYETDGIPVSARMRLSDVYCHPEAQALEVNILEEPLAQNSASLQDGILHVDLPAYSTVTVKIFSLETAQCTT